MPLIALLSPPACVLLSSAVLALASARLARGSAPLLFGTAIAAAGLLGAGAAFPGWLPDVVPDKSKALTKVRPQGKLYSRWGPVFRVDVTRSAHGEHVRLIHHDGLLGSTLHRFDRSKGGLARFDEDARSLPFRVLGSAPRKVLIIGAAGGHEVLASLHFGAEHVDAVELNPITVSLLTDVYPDYSGRLHEDPRVHLVESGGGQPRAGHGSPEEGTVLGYGGRAPSPGDTRGTRERRSARLGPGPRQRPGEQGDFAPCQPIAELVRPIPLRHTPR